MLRDVADLLWDRTLSVAYDAPFERVHLAARPLSETRNLLDEVLAPHGYVLPGGSPLHGRIVRLVVGIALTDPEHRQWALERLAAMLITLERKYGTPDTYPSIVDDARCDLRGIAAVVDGMVEKDAREDARLDGSL